tara:strand:+ start:57 stop:494 length:438 start_codon:yes stop_codon:yes gene_type:complete
MILISHRGNISGKNTDLENSPEYINSALKMKYNVEIDIFYFKKDFYLGHDKPTYKIKKNFLKNKNLWIHAKNFEALSMLKGNAHNFFWHENDQYTLTNRGYIWTYPGRYLGPQSIAVSLNKKKIAKNIYGICSDYVDFYRSKNYE